MSRRRRSASNSKLGLVVGGMVVVLLGLGLVFKDKIKERFRPAPPRVVKKRVEPVERRPEVEPEAPKAEPVVAKPEEPVARPVVDLARPKRPVPAKDLLAASRLHEKARTSWAGLEFRKAIRYLKAEEKLLSNDPDQVKALRAFREKAEVFDKVTSGLELNPEAGSSYVTLEMDGREISGALTGETETHYVIEARKGIKHFQVPKDEVIQVVRHSGEEQRERLLQEFKEFVAGNKATSGPAHYVNAERAYRDGLKKQAIEHLDKAFAASGKDLPRDIRVHGARRLLGHAVWCQSTDRTGTAKMWCNKIEKNYADLEDIVAEARKLKDEMAKPVKAFETVSFKTTTVKRPSKKPGRRPSTRSARPTPAVAAAPPSAREERTTATTTKVASASGRNDKLVGDINKTFDEGVQHYIKGRPGNRNANQHLKKAVKLFDQVVQMCDKALR
ncbi:MAG: hypothetical protein ACYS9X_32100, partial [Planctomycetota bacterium]